MPQRMSVLPHIQHLKCLILWKVKFHLKIKHVTLKIWFVSNYKDKAFSWAHWVSTTAKIFKIAPFLFYLMLIIFGRWILQTLQFITRMCKFIASDFEFLWNFKNSNEYSKSPKIAPYFEKEKLKKEEWKIFVYFYFS